MSLAQQPEWKQLLFDVVRKEGLDPWNIDLNVLTDKFMSKLNEMKSFDFRIPANAILASSILLRFKSDRWKISPLHADSLQPMFIPDGIIQPPVFPELQPVFRETHRRVTLDELIDAIEDVMIKEKVKASKQSKVKKEVPRELIELVSSENIDFEKRLSVVFDKVKSSVDSSGLTTLSQLVPEKDVNEFLNTFVPMLHLANRGFLNLWQEEVFGEIFIQLNKNKEKEFKLNRGVVDGRAKGS